MFVIVVIIAIAGGGLYWYNRNRTAR